MFFKRVILWYGMVWYGMVCFAILCYGMVWKVWYAMRFQCYAMRFLCYAMVYVVKDKHIATVIMKSTTFTMWSHVSDFTFKTSSLHDVTAIFEAIRGTPYKQHMINGGGKMAVPK